MGETGVGKELFANRLHERSARRESPFVIVDPRAGHGPGIGGFKADSEIGVASRAGHACYFVGFTPEPEPGQTIEDVMRAEEVFLEKIIDLHPEAEGKPCVIGNCQAGWAVMMLAAVRPDLFGPIIVPGSPMSYWAGKRGQNPMRYTGGLLGGSWLTALSSDLGKGKFDGAYLVENFENMNPANTYWTKNYNLWSKVDTEAERFLGSSDHRCKERSVRANSCRQCGVVRRTRPPDRRRAARDLAGRLLDRAAAAGPARRPAPVVGRQRRPRLSPGVWLLVHGLRDLRRARLQDGDAGSRRRRPPAAVARRAG